MVLSNKWFFIKLPSSEQQLSFYLQTIIKLLDRSPVILILYHTICRNWQLHIQIHCLISGQFNRDLAEPVLYYTISNTILDVKEKKKEDKQTGLLSSKSISCLYDLTGNCHQSIMEHQMKSLYIQRNLPRTTVQYIWCPQNRTHPFTKKIPK